MSILAPSQHVRTWLEKLPAQQAPTVIAVRTLIGAIAPDAHEIVYHDALCYSPTDAGFDAIVYIAAFGTHVNLGFYYGGFLQDPDGLLLGTGKRMRHIKIRSPQECTNPAVARLLEQAWMDGLHRVAQPHRA
jgi:Domain of unknown function (DU1801)